MVDMSVKIGDVTFQNPIMPASGAFSTDLEQVMDLNRLGALVMKTVSREFRIGNPTPRVTETPGGLSADPAVMERLKTMTLDAVTEPTREKVQKRVEWLFKDKGSIPPDLVETRFRIYSQPGYREVTERILCLQEMDVRKRNMVTEDDLRAIKTPTLLVWTVDDPLAGIGAGEWCRDNIAGCRWLLLDQSGHWPQFEEADAFNRAHLEFLRDG